MGGLCSDECSQVLLLGETSGILNKGYCRKLANDL